MQYAIEIKNLCKQYPKFALQSVSFTLPMGYIMGFIGENGAGKTTVMKSMLHLVRPDSGTVLLLGQDATKENAALKQQIGVVLDTANFPQSFTTQDVHQMLKRVYSNWDGALYQQYLEQFHLPEKKKFKEFSMGMKKKLAVAAALAHHPKLLILDEVTAGLDPMVREEILDVFRDFVSDGEHSILISSHIISDLEKICDYITFLHEGTVLFSMGRDTLLDTNRCKPATLNRRFSSSPPQRIPTLHSQWQRKRILKRYSNKPPTPIGVSRRSCLPSWKQQRTTRATPTQ